MPNRNRRHDDEEWWIRDYGRKYDPPPDEPGMYTCACCGREATVGTVHKSCMATGVCPHGLGAQSTCGTCASHQDFQDAAQAERTTL